MIAFVPSRPFCAAGGAVLSTAYFQALKKQREEKCLNENSLPNLYYYFFAKRCFFQLSAPMPQEPMSSKLEAELLSLGSPAWLGQGTQG